MRLNIYCLPIGKEKLDMIPEEERNLFILLGHVWNEISFFRKLLVWCFDPNQDDEVQNRGQISQAISIAKVLAGKLLEGREVLQRDFHPTALREMYLPKLKPDAQQALDKINKYFGDSNNLIKKIRNDHAFHYDMDSIRLGYDHADDDDELVLYLSNQDGNSLYYLAEVISNYGLIQLGDGQDLQQRLDNIFHEIDEIAASFNLFVNDLLASILNHNFPNEDDLNVCEPLSVEMPIEWKSFSIPYFTANQ